MFRRIFKVLVWTSLGCVGLVFVVVAAILIWPSLVLNDRTLALARDLAKRQGIELVWSEGHLRGRSPAALQKRAEFEFRDLCVKILNSREPGGPMPVPTRLLDGCFERVEFGATINLGGFKPRFLDLGPIKIIGRELSVTPATNAPKVARSKVATEEPTSGVSLNGPLFSEARIEPVEIRVERFHYPGVDGRIAIQTSTPADGPARVTARAGLALGTGKARSRITGEAELSNPAGFRELRGWALRASVAAALADGGRARVTALADPRGPGQRAGRVPGQADGGGPGGAAGLDYDYRVRADYRGARGRQAASAQLEGRLRDRDLQGHLRASVDQFIASLPRVWTSACDFHFTERVQLDCPIQARVAVAPIKGIGKKLPTETGVRIRADLKTPSFPPALDKEVHGTIEAELQPIATPLLQGGGNVKARVDGIPGPAMKLDSQVDLKLAIRSFETLVAELSQTDWAIPAPFHFLKGQVSAGLTGSFDAKKGEFPVHLETRLHSPAQKLDIDAEGKLKLLQLMPSPKLSLDADVALSDIALELPRLDLGAPPRLFPDPRIQSVKQQAGVAPPAESAFDYSVRVRTFVNNPVRILSNLAKAPIPVGVALDLTAAEGMDGNIDVQNFPIEFFRRKGNVSHFELSLAEPTEQSELDGAIDIDYTDYVVTVQLLGTIEKPVVRLKSDPPLAEDQIVAVLLFGRTMDELDSDERSTVGNTGAAIADRALGLASLYALASTPIQSLGYDPRSGQVLVKVRLGEGTSLNLAGGGATSGGSATGTGSGSGTSSSSSTSGGGLEQVGIRKRLSKHWSITTELSNLSRSAASKSEVLSAFLQWSARY